MLPAVIHASIPIKFTENPTSHFFAAIHSSKSTLALKMCHAWAQRQRYKGEKGRHSFHLHGIFILKKQTDSSQISKHTQSRLCKYYKRQIQGAMKEKYESEGKHIRMRPKKASSTRCNKI